MFLVFFEPATVGVVGELPLIQEDGMSEEIQRMIANQIEAAAKSFKQFYHVQNWQASAPEHKSSGLGVSIHLPLPVFFSKQTCCCVLFFRPACLGATSTSSWHIHGSMDHIKQLNCYFLRAHLVPTFSHCMLMYVGAGQIQSSSLLNQ
jgi:hypothetical protein